MRSPFVRTVHSFQTLPSTNTKARDYIQSGAPVGTTVVAAVQTAGRGRSGRTWHSPSGGLYFSTLLIPSRPGRETELSILGGAAVAQAIKEMLPKKPTVSLKWPNDVLIGTRKVAGILSESVGDETAGMCILGVGINLNASQKELEGFSANAFPATSLSVELEGSTFEAAAVLDLVLTKLEALYALYWERGFEYVRQVWHDNCRMTGKKVQIENPGFLGHKDLVVSRPLQGFFVGINPDGAMIVRTESGKDLTFFSGEIKCFWP